MAIPPTESLVTKSLFGGAISMDLPESYGDASDLRQIPDNQEVFLSQSSDTSVVIEILALVEEGMASTDLWEAVKYHFNSIAHDNASLESTILTPPPPSPRPSRPSPPGEAETPEPIILTGTQTIHKFSHNPTGAPRPGHESEDPDDVFVGVALWRIWVDSPSMAVDKEGPETGEGSGKKKADVVCSVNVNLSAPNAAGEAERERVEEWWLRSVGSLRILDWNLFGDVE